MSRSRASRNPALGASVVVMLMVLTGCELATDSGPRRAGPFDPGANELPDSATIETICGGRINRLLLNASDAYTNVADNWERITVYVDAVGADGLTVDEAEAGIDRIRLLDQALIDYTSSIDDVRYGAVDVTGPNAGECDRQVVARFEVLVVERATEIDYVTQEANKLERRLDKVG